MIVGERRFDPIGPENGISHRSVNAIVQDSLGFLWFGTDEGLNRFDGVSNQVWLRSPGSADGLASSRIAALIVDRHGYLWCGTRGGGLSRFDTSTETFTTFRHSDEQPHSLAQDDVVALTEDHLGRIWIGTSKEGLDRLDDPTATAEVVRFVHHRCSNEDDRSIPDDRIRTLLRDRSDRLWIGTMNGIGRLEPDGGFARFQGSGATAGTLTDGEVWSLEVDDHDRLWVGTWGGGLFRSRESASSSELTFVNYPGNGRTPGTLADSRVMALHQDHSGTLWVGTLTGLHELPQECLDDDEPAFVRHFHGRDRSDSLPSDRISAIGEDRAGDLWFATTRGPCRLERTHEGILLLRVERQLTATPPSVRDVAVADDGAIWIATDAGILRVRLASDRRSPPHVLSLSYGERGLPDAQIVALLCDHQGAIWIATFDGLAFISAADAALDEFQVTHIPAQPDDPNGLSSNAVLTLYQDEHDDVWIGTYRGLHRTIRDEAGIPTRFEGYFHDADDPNSLSSRSVSAIASFDGDLWVGTYSGLNRMDRVSGRCERFGADPIRGALPHAHITSLLRDDDGALWIGTLGGGIARRPPGDDRCDTLDLERGMPSELIYSLGKTADGSVWAATAAGIVRVHPFRDDVLILSARDGLPGDEIDVLSATPDGRLVAASGSRLIVASAHDLEPGTVAPRVILTSVRVANDQSRWSDVSKSLFDGAPDVVLANSESALRIDFAAPDYRHPDHIRYRYRMTGLSSSWVTTSGERRAYFPLLAPGNYTFELSTALGDGAWSEPGARISIKVLPPWWRTWWAISLAVAALIIATVTIPVVRLSQVRRRAAHLDATVAERTAELAEVNHQLAVAARTDPLTQLPNRRAAAERVEIERATLRRYRRPLSVALLDIDHFKNVNDDFGHDVGDRVLRAVGDLLRATVRERDFVARWGGEEFLLLLPETPLASGTKVAEGLRGRVAALTLPEVDGRNLTVTIGITSLLADETFEACVNRADHSLYRGKKSGRNRVIATQGPEDPNVPTPRA